MVLDAKVYDHICACPIPAMTPNPRHPTSTNCKDTKLDVHQHTITINPSAIGIEPTELISLNTQNSCRY